jgi:hypothetical protein
MNKFLRFSIIILIIFISYGFGVISLKYNLFPTIQLKTLWNSYLNPNIISFQPITSDKAFQFNISRLSYFQLDESGNLIVDDKRSKINKKFFIPDDKLYNFTAEFTPTDTVILLMDVWKDSGTEFLNDQFTPIFYESVLPLVQAFSAKGFQQFAFTNSENYLGYGKDLFPELEIMIEDGKIFKMHHSKDDQVLFENILKVNSIKNIIYLGFSSNMCIINRRAGMIAMSQKGFNTYLVPEGSAAIETGAGWDTGEFHKFTTSLIRQNYGTISKESILKALINNKQ